MMNINIDISNTSIGSYSLNAIYSKVQIIFSGIPEEWEGNRIYAAFVQDSLDPIVEVIDNAVLVPNEILQSGTDFYVSVYAIAYGSSQVSEPSSPILITVDATKSSEFDLIELIKSIVNLRSKLDAITVNKVDKINGKDLSSNDFTDKHIEQIDTNTVNIENLSNQVADIEADLHQLPITTIPTTLESNKQYNFGEVTELALVFPTLANDGDVIYATFMTGENVTALTIDTTNTCDIELVPEKNTGYEVFGKFNGSIWVVAYSEYIVSEG